jgi:2-polyprenyl-3-methyl-5-hydroxy-6-metoxy-1,4-benzoquinol methylase
MGMLARVERRTATLGPPDAGLFWCCPRCHGSLRTARDALACESCGAGYPVIDDIPDLRVSRPVWIDIDADRESARQLAAAGPKLDVRDLVRMVFAKRDAWDEARITTRTAQVLDAVTRLRAAFDDWLRPVMREKSILDIGCGPGMLTAAIAGTDRVALGIDASLVWLVVAKRLVQAQGGCPVLAAALAEALPLRNGAVGAVVALDVIEHVGDLPGVLREIDRVTAGGGVVLLSTPNRFTLAAEPHVHVWGVGWLPRRIQAPYVRWRSGLSYEYTRTLSAWEALRTLRRHTRLTWTLQVPRVPDDEIARFPRMRAALARAYNRLTRVRALRLLWLAVGPFYRVLGRMPARAAVGGAS